MIYNSPVEVVVPVQDAKKGIAKELIEESCWVMNASE
jgi:hypothetical protein